jgi:aryl-alcohol dehydrogenase-like predicted oxidoreductase
MKKVELATTGICAAIPILGFSNRNQLDHNLKALEVSLCEEQMNMLNKASA